MIDIREKTEWDDKAVGDYIRCRELVADNFDNWSMKQKLAIIRALLEGDLSNNNGIG